jgi:cyclophilin family peptidyl-prolyl cis-trans isomerase
VKRKHREKPDSRKPPAAPTPSQPAPASGAPKPANPALQWIVVLAVLGIVGGLVGVFLFLGSGPSGPNPLVEMETSQGTITIELYPREAPITVQNFLQYVDDRHYDGTIFHRVITKFMAQGGGMTPNGVEKPGRAPIRNEASNGLLNERGTIAMARTDNPHSATAQFFINVADNKFLNQAEAPDKYGYAVFGRVTNGMGVVDKIVSLRGPGDRPVEDVIIKSVRRVEKQ